MRWLQLAVLTGASPLLLGNESCGGGPVNDIGDDWLLFVDVTVANGVCEGEEDGEGDDDPDEMTIVQGVVDAGVAELTATVTPHDGGDPYTLTGPFEIGERCLAELSGTRTDEDGGTTTSRFTLRPEGPGTFPPRLQGTEEWTWSGGGGDCPDGRSVVWAERQ